MLNEIEKNMVVKLICDEQNRMTAKDYMQHESEEYKIYEIIKVKIKDM